MDSDDLRDDFRDERVAIRRRMYRGDSFILDTQIMRPPPGSPAGTPPVPTNITGWQIWFTVKRTVVDTDSQAICQLTIGTSGQGSIVVVNPAIGQIETTMNPIVTRGFPDSVTRVVYDIQVRDTNGNDFTVEKGVLDVIPDVTEAI